MEKECEIPYEFFDRLEKMTNDPMLKPEVREKAKSLNLEEYIKVMTPIIQRIDALQDARAYAKSYFRRWEEGGGGFRYDFNIDLARLLIEKYYDTDIVMELTGLTAEEVDKLENWWKYK